MYFSLNAKAQRVYLFTNKSFIHKWHLNMLQVFYCLPREAPAEQKMFQMDYMFASIQKIHDTTRLQTDHLHVWFVKFNNFLCCYNTQGL